MKLPRVLSKKCVCALIFMALLCLQCGGKKSIALQTSLPHNSEITPLRYENPVFTPIMSTISIPIAMQPAFLENIINTQINELLYQNDSLTILPGISKAQLKVYRASSVRIGLLCDELVYKIPLRLVVRIGVGVTTMGVTLEKSHEIEAGISLRMRTTVKIKSDWKVTTTTFLDGYDWISDPSVKVAGVSIPFGPAADVFLGSMKGKLGKMVDKSIADNLNFKAMIKPYWESMQKPMLLSDTLGIWLKLSLHSISMTQLHGTSGYIASSIGVTAIAETYCGREPATDTIVPLPDVTISDVVAGGFKLNLYSELSYSYLQTMSRQMLCGKPMDVNGKPLIIDSLWVNGDSGLIRIEVTLSGAYKGKVKLCGTPMFDTATSVFCVNNVVFDLNSRNILLSTASWMLNGLIQKKVTEALRIPIEQELFKSKNAINTSLATFKPIDNITLMGSVDSLRVRGFMLTSDAVKIAVQAQGKLGIKFETLLTLF